MIGKTLGHYEILAKVGEGGMGEVWRARDAKLGRDVAIKILPRDMSGDPERIARFRREARTLASLQHANIASIYDFEDTPEARFLVMELVEGEDLQQRIARGALPVDEVVNVARQIAAGLEAAHENSVMHRDLKPANVKITPDGGVKILDFGLARAWLGDGEDNVDPAHSPTITAAMTQAGTILGTAAYMSPEQARGKRVDRRADIWAFGVIVVEMLRGKTLFPGETVSDTLAGVLKTEIDLSTLPGNTPIGLRRLIERCLDRNPQTRLRDIGEARVALERPLGGAPDATPARPARRGRMFLVGALAGIVVGVTAISLFQRPAPTESARPVRFSIPRQTSDDAPRAAISRDGNRLLYVDQGRLWVRVFSEPESREVTGSEGAIVGDWSPDAESIVWSTATTLYRARPDGSGRMRLCEVSTDMHPWAGGLAWTDDGRILFAPGDSGIFAVGENGGDPVDFLPAGEADTDFHDVELLPGGGVLFHPHIDLDFDSIHISSAKGRKELLRLEGQQLNSARYSSGHILFSRSPANRGIWALPFALDEERATGSPFMVIPDAEFPSISAAGDLVYVPNAADVWNLIRIDRNGGITARIGDGVEGASDLSVSPDETQAAFVTSGSSYEIWIMDTESGQKRRLLFDDEELANPSWSPDGTRIVHSVGGGGPGTHIEIRPLLGGSPEVVDVRGWWPQLTPDERHLVLEFWDEHNDPGIGYVALEDPDHTVVPIVDSNYGETTPALSPDGTLIAYESLESGRREVYATTFPDGERTWQISTEGGSQPSWSKDNGQLIFRSAGFPEKLVVDVSRGPLRFSAPRSMFRVDSVSWLNPTANGEFFGLERKAGSGHGSFEVWLGWAQTVRR